MLERARTIRVVQASERAAPCDYVMTMVPVEAAMENMDFRVEQLPALMGLFGATYIVAMLKHLLLGHTRPLLSVWPGISVRSSHESNRVLYSIVRQPLWDFWTHCCKVPRRDARIRVSRFSLFGKGDQTSN